MPAQQHSADIFSSYTGTVLIHSTIRIPNSTLIAPAPRCYALCPMPYAPCSALRTPDQKPPLLFPSIGISFQKSGQRLHSTNSINSLDSIDYIHILTLNGDITDRFFITVMVIPSDQRRIILPGKIAPLSTTKGGLIHDPP
jgi:hypothetical protein